MDRVHERERADGVGHFHDPGDGVESAHGIRGEADGHQARPRPKRPLQALQIERAVILADLHPSGPDAALLFQSEPRRHVGVVVQASHDDLVARLERPSDGPAHGEREGGHVLPEDDLGRIGRADVVGRRCVNLGQHRVALFARGEGPLVVGVR